jgi:hypothetical protein
MATWITGDTITATRLNERALRHEFRNLLMETRTPTLLEWSADDVVFDDGRRIVNCRSVIDCTASGANGIDIGSGSGWHKVLAIAKEDGTVAGILKKAVSYNALGAYSLLTNNGALNLRSISGNAALAQVFTPSVTRVLSHADLRVLRVGTPAAGSRMWLELRTTSGGSPTSTVLATSNAIDVRNGPSSGAQWARFVFRGANRVTLSSGTAYALVVTGNYTPDGTNYLTVNKQDSGSGAYVFNGTSWSSASTGLTAAVYAEVAEAALSYPTGYTAEAHLGWVYITAGEMGRFQAVNRSYLTFGGNLQWTALTTTAEMQLSDLFNTLLPPIPVVAEVVICHATAAAWVAAAGVPHGWAKTPSAVSDDVAVGYAAAAGTTYPTQVIGRIVTDKQALYVAAQNSSSGGKAGIRQWEW